MEILYKDFVQTTPVLYGQIIVNNKAKIGAFKPGWCYLSNSRVYQYYTPKGNKGKGGFTLMRAWQLLKADRLSPDPEMGKVENYV